MMNTIFWRWTGLMSLVIVIVGCSGSPPSNHYVLSAKAATPPSAKTPSLGIGPITVPEYLNRSGLVYSRQGNKLQVSGTERWAEPLEDGITRVISMNLAALVDTHNVRFFPGTAGAHRTTGSRSTCCHWMPTMRRPSWWRSGCCTNPRRRKRLADGSASSGIHCPAVRWRRRKLPPPTVICCTS